MIYYAMEQTTLISTFYSFDPFVAAAHAVSPNVIVLIVDAEKEKEVNENIKKVRDFYGSVTSVNVETVKGSDLLAITQKTVDLIEKAKGRVVVYVGGGKKLTAQGVLYGCYARAERVEKILCNNVNDQTIVELPKLTYGLTKPKRILLEKIAARDGKSIKDIADSLGKTRGMLYQHLKELKENGYVDEKFEITLAGRMALL